MKETVLWATRIGAPDWQEEVITDTTDEQRLANAKQWALDNGFNRLRTYELDNKVPNFAATVRL